MGNYKAGKGRSAKQSKKGLEAKIKSGGAPDQEAEYAKCPHTFVFNKNKVGKNLSKLIKDVRKVMEPFTASKLKVRKRNNLNDFLSVAGVYNVTHMMMFSRTDKAINLKICCVPRGPTFNFKVEKYSLVRDVISSLRKYHMEQKQFLHHPLLVINNFTASHPSLKLLATMFQNMFPSINVNKARLNDYKRCVVLDYNTETSALEFRHYNITVVPTGLSKPVRKVIKPKIPDLSKYKDIDEFITKGGNLSESEAELDGPSNEVVLPQPVSGRGNMVAAKSAVRLTEIGPRMTLSLRDIQEGINSGEYLYGGKKSVPKTGAAKEKLGRDEVNDSIEVEEYEDEEDENEEDEDEEDEEEEDEDEEDEEEDEMDVDEAEDSDND